MMPNSNSFYYGVHVSIDDEIGVSCELYACRRALKVIQYFSQMSQQICTKREQNEEIFAIWENGSD